MKYLLLTFISIFLFSTSVNYALSDDGNSSNSAARKYRNCAPCHGLNNGNLAGMKEEKFLYYIQQISQNNYIDPLFLEIHSDIYNLTKNQAKDLAKYVHNLK